MENFRLRHSSRLPHTLTSFALAAWLSFSQCPAYAQGRSDGADGFQALSKAAKEAKDGARSEQAIQLYGQALAQNSGWSEGWRSLGILLADGEQYGRAQTAFQNLVRLQPRSGDAWVLLGLCEFRMEQYDPAVADLERARAFDIADKALLRLLYYYSAAIMILRGDFDTAQIRLLLLAREGVNSKEMMEAYGLAALRIAALPGTESAGVRNVALEVGELVADVRHMTVQESRAEFGKLLAKYPRQPGLHYAYGKHLASHALYSQACEAFKRELDNSPGDAMAYVQIATLQSQQLGNPKEALPSAEEAVKLAPQLFVSHFVLGRTLLKLGEIDRAVAELEKAAGQAPQSVMVHTLLLRAYNKANREKDTAREQEVLRRLQEQEASLKGRGSGAAQETTLQVKDR